MSKGQNYLHAKNKIFKTKQNKAIPISGHSSKTEVDQ